MAQQDEVAVALELVAGIGPSFCWPLVLAPNTVITRPRTGQRNDGAAAVGSPVAALASLLVSGADVAMRTLGCDSAAETFCAATGAAGRVATAGAVAGFAGAGASPGIVMRSPILSWVWGAMRFAAAIAATDLW
jgi:hypothetical protein